MQRNYVLQKLIYLGNLKFHGFHGNPLNDFKERGVPAKIIISERQLILENTLGVKLILGHSMVTLRFEMQII